MNANHEHESEFEQRLRSLPADDTARPEHQTALREQALNAFDQARRKHSQQSFAKRLAFFLGEIS
jgi:hypothetical protein